MENKPHILCVDDDDKIRELLKVFLRKNQCETQKIKGKVPLHGVAYISG